MKIPKDPRTQIPKRRGVMPRLLDFWVLGYLGPSLLLAGCCNSRDVELIEVSGYVTLDGNPPPGAGTIYFTPYEALGGEPLRPARAYFDETGYFRAGAFHDADGLIPAKYRVGIHCWEVEPTIDGPPAVSFVPARYMNAGTSGLEMVVKPGSYAIEWNADLVSDAPN